MARRHKRFRKWLGVSLSKTPKVTTINHMSISNMVNLVEHMKFTTITRDEVSAVIKLYPNASKIEIIGTLEQLETYRLKEKQQQLLPATVA